MSGLEDAAEAHFAGKPWALKLYQAVRGAVQGFGGPGAAVAQAAKTQVAFHRRTAFAWLWLTRDHLHRGPDDLVLSFGLRRPLASPRVKQSAHPTPSRWTHHVVLRDAAQLDAELVGWLREAWEDAA